MTSTSENSRNPSRRAILGAGGAILGANRRSPRGGRRRGPLDGIGDARP